MKLQISKLMRSVVFVLLLVPISLAAQQFSRSDVYGGFQYGFFGNVHTWDPYSSGSSDVNNASLDVNGVGWDAAYAVHINKSIGVAADFSGGVGRPSNQEGGVGGVMQSVQYHVQTYNLAFGPVYSFEEKNGIQPFVHALIGGGYATGSACAPSAACISLTQRNHNGLSTGGFITYLGGGVDKKFNKSVSFRGQFDWFDSYGEYTGGTKNIRLTAGVVYRF